MKPIIRLLWLLLVSSTAPAFSADAPALPASGCGDLASFETAGFNSTGLCDALKDFSLGKTNLHSLVIERHGVVVAEMYKHGKDESIYSIFSRETDFDATDRHDIRSISKSITSLLWGIAQAQNKTPALDTPVLDLLPELAGLKIQGRQSITIAHLLSMSSGLDWNEPNTYNSSNDEIGLYWRSAQAHYLFNRPMVAPAGTRFNYNGGGTAVLAQILAQRVGMSLPDYARKMLFEPLGITDWEWINDVRGRPLAFAGLRMRPMDLARLGRMVLNHGQWQGKQIVPAEWITESTRAHIDTGDGLQYGYQWWAGTIGTAKQKHDWSAGFGNGGQRLFMVPDLDLVIVITAGDYNKAEIGRVTYQLFKRIALTVRE